MKSSVAILFVFFLFMNTVQGKILLPVTPAVNCEKDTIIKESAEDSLIRQVVSLQSVPEKEKAEQLGQLTRFGFRNLFNQFDYNPAIPYTSQVNPHAELFMRDYLRIHQTSLLKMKEQAVPYFNLIENIFTQYGLPHELKYLAVIESSLKTSATSWVGAAGPWQFMPQTARIYGLKVDRNSDERRDYFKSTHAAAKLLLHLYSEYHDWLLVIAAYNGGSERVRSAIQKTKSRNFWNLQYHLPEESRNHVKKFIATHYVMENNSASLQFNSDAGIAETPGLQKRLTPEEISSLSLQTISGKYDAGVLAKHIGMDLREFSRYNPYFDEQLARDGQTELRLPSEKMELFHANKYRILDECVQLLLGKEADTAPVNPAQQQKTSLMKKSKN